MEESKPVTVSAEPAPTATLECPSCKATLQKVSITAGVRVNCLRCGARFYPAGIGGPNETAADSAPDGTKTVAREPKSPGYWLLRIPAAILCVAGIFIAALIAWTEVPKGTLTIYFWLAASFVPLLPLAGLLAFFGARSLARVDAGLSRLLWKKAILTEPLPAMRGSSLPYIGPLAVVGGLLPLFRFIFIEQTPQELIRGAIPGALLFFAGFMAEDLRQFAWRQTSLADHIARRSAQSPPRPGDPVSRWTGWASVIGFGSLTLCEIYLAHHSTMNSYGRQDLMLYSMLALLFGGLAVTGAKLSADWDLATACWVRLAAQVDRGSEARLSWFKRRLIWVPILWAIYSVGWLLFFLFSTGLNREFTTAYWLMGFGVIGAGLWFSRMLRQVARWRAAQRRVCAALQKETDAPAGTPLLGWPVALVQGTFALAALEAVLMGWMMYYESTRGKIPEWRIILMIPIVIIVFTYPTVWVAMIFREFLSLERYLGDQPAGDSH
jgi:hypothetical protein